MRFNNTVYFILKHALSFDIEDWFHIVGVQELENISQWEVHSNHSIVERRTRQILQILSRFNVKATFFILGWIADRYPELVKEIADAGHEIGTHSYWHRCVYDLTPQEFYEDLARSIESISRASGTEVTGFRAPSFSIKPGNEWAMKAMRKLGIKYDASLFPAKRGNGGYRCVSYPHLFNYGSGEVIPELPMSVVEVGRLNIPFSGGGYVRFLPKSVIRYGFNKFEKKKIPCVTYLHPRDFAPECPRVAMNPFKRFKSYTGLHTTEAKLVMLLEEYEFTTCENVLKTWFEVEDLAELVLSPKKTPHANKGKTGQQQMV